MYQRPDMITPSVDAQGQPIDPCKIQEHFEDASGRSSYRLSCSIREIGRNQSQDP
ncbi:hypothetical protein I3760_09G189700 [Carya illinoinensis]|nr:hypothetical protein I3760_09G189700 [Carya illinoinensis]